jgi:hypothetical protein
VGVLHALKGVGNRAFHRWLTRDYRPLFPRLPERTRLFRLFKTHQDWTRVFLASPTVLGVIDTYGIELIHPIREGRSPQQIGRKGLSNHRWIVGGKLCLLLNQYGLVVGWDCGTAHVADNTFPGRADGYPTGRRLRSRDCSRLLASELDVKVSLHPAQASRRPCDGPVSSHTICWLYDTAPKSMPLRGR